MRINSYLLVSIALTRLRQSGTDYHQNYKQLPRSTYSVKGRLTVLVLACLVPAVAMVLALIFYYHQQDVIQSRVDTVSKAAGISSELDSRMASVVSSLETLASSELLAKDDFEGFHRRAQDVMRSQRLKNITLYDHEGRQLLNTFVPYGTPLPKMSQAQVQALTRASKQGFVDLFNGPVVGQPVVAAVVPVPVSNGATLGLSATLTPANLRELLISDERPSNWITAIVDTQGVLMARNISPEQFVGQKVRAALFARMREVQQATVDSVTLDGVPVVTAFHRSALTGWTVAIGVPKRELTARLQSSLVLLLAGTVMLVLGSLALANFYGKRITQTITALTTQAAALGRGEVIRSVPLDFREAEQLTKAFQDSAEQLAVAKSALVQRNLDLQQFAFVASHDLRVPLKTVNGFLSLLKLRYSAALDPKAVELIDRTTQAVTAMDQLTLDLLTYARLDSGAHVFAPVDCAEVVDHTLVFLEASIRQTGAIIATGPLPTVQGDRSQLIQLFQNLISNALNYCTASPPRVGIQASRGVGEWIFSIADNGIGIDAQHHQRIFEVF